MSDLISRSEVIEQMWWLYNNYVNNANNFEQEETEALNRAFSRLQKVFEDLPIAYDKEAVVKQLEEAKEQIAKEDYCRTKHFDENDCEHKDCFKCCAEHLIKIVKAGGTDGN